MEDPEDTATGMREMAIRLLWEQVKLGSIPRFPTAGQAVQNAAL